MWLSAPTPLHAEHLLDDFRCSAPALAKWLLERARQNQASGASRCFVACDEQHRVVGYYALSAGSIAHEAVPGRIRRNMPDPIPVIVLGRLAVHADRAGQGIGQGLLKDAVLRALQACGQVGARALLCHAIDEPAKAFYLKHGFIASPIHPLTLMLPLMR
ncbi:TPA: GNAT family N-acetyltransferase [Stenotrophomonas maltophilia]|nr:GNAT family N-acetyltransferase [Stenotrophomonas maltophilia]